jgi:hypothetical protein
MAVHGPGQALHGTLSSLRHLRALLGQMVLLALMALQGQTVPMALLVLTEKQTLIHSYY